MIFQLKHRFTDAVLFECVLPQNIAGSSVARQKGYAVKEALKARANLAGANLADANLARANLARANLADANLAGAYLARANLADANLAGANLADANLAGANLAGAYLARANLADAYLADAYLADAYLADAYLAGANLADANLAGANLADAYLADAYLADAYLADARNVPETNGSEATEPYERAITDEQRAARYAKRAAKFRERNPDVPVVENIDARILAAVESGTGKLDMSQWHTCETTHCRAGWAITLAGEKGKQLELENGPFHAGRMIYLASSGRVPHFYASQERAMEDIRECAGVTP